MCAEPEGLKTYNTHVWRFRAGFFMYKLLRRLFYYYCDDHSRYYQAYAKLVAFKTY